MIGYDARLWSDSWPSVKGDCEHCGRASGQHYRAYCYPLQKRDAGFPSTHFRTKTWQHKDDRPTVNQRAIARLLAMKKKGWI